MEDYHISAAADCVLFGWSDYMQVAFISDIHGQYPDLYDTKCELLIIAGDMCARDYQKDWDEFFEWINDQDFEKIIFIAGNHDNYLQKKEFKHLLSTKVTYLQDEGIEYNGLFIYGTPWTMTFRGMNKHCKAFTCDTEDKMREKFGLIPDNTDILISHSPPYGVLDEVQKYKHSENCGSVALREALDRVKPAVNVFGHIHEKGGRSVVYKHLGPNTYCINASVVDESYQPRDEIITLEI